MKMESVLLGIVLGILLALFAVGVRDVLRPPAVTKDETREIVREEIAGIRPVTFSLPANFTGTYEFLSPQNSYRFSSRGSPTDSSARIGTMNVHVTPSQTETIRAEDSHGLSEQELYESTWHQWSPDKPEVKK